MNKNDFFNFTDDSCGIKSGLFLIGLLLIGIIIWNLLGLSGGRGGNPQEGYRDEYQYE
jgi:hypothetical protein